MAFVDQSVREAITAAQRGGPTLSYSGIQNIIRSTFDQEGISVQEREDLREVLRTQEMDVRARRALWKFLDHVDALSGRADALAKASGNKNHGMRLEVPDPGTFSRRNTSLGKFSHGNFDVEYDPDEGELNVILKVKYGFDRALTPGEQSEVKRRLQQAVAAWDNVQATLETSSFVLNPVIRIRFILREVSKDEHKPVDVTTDGRREWIGMDINIHKLTTAKTLTHELGHVFGNYDEYRGGGFMGWLEARMYWHDNRFLSDTNALMQSGSEFRPRYFSHFERFVNDNFHKVGASYLVTL